MWRLVAPPEAVIVAPDRDRGVIANRSFVLLFSAQVISLLGSGATTVALALLAYDMAGSGSAAAVLGNALMLRILAFLLFSQPAGILADRVPRKRILVVADIARAILLMLLPLVSETWQVYVLVFAINAVTAFFTPAYEASLPVVVGAKHLVRALALSRVATDVEAVAAPATAALIVAAVGARWVFAFDALTYVVSALLVIGATLPVVAGTEHAKPARFLLDVTHGARVILAEPALRRAVLMSLVESLAGACAIVATVAYVRDVLHESESVVGWAMGAVGLGSSLAALGLGRWARAREGAAGGSLHSVRHRWSERALWIGGAALCASLLPGATSPPLVALLALWALNGAGQALIAIPSSVLLAEHTDAAERGRVYAAHFALTHAGWLIAYPVVGHAASRWGPASAFTSAGLAGMLIVLVAAIVRRVEREAPSEHEH